MGLSIGILQKPGAEGDKFHFLVLRSESRSQMLFSGKETEWTPSAKSCRGSPPLGLSLQLQ